MTSLEKQCWSGALYCQLVEAAHPGTVDMKKVNLQVAPGHEHTALNNYKALETALAKLDIDQTRSIDVCKLSQGQPQATIELMQILHSSFSDGGDGTPRRKGLGAQPVDPNAPLAASGSSKRKAAPAAAAAKRAARGEKAPEAVEVAPPCVEDGEGVSVERTAMQQLEAARAELASSRAEATGLREEAAFYYRRAPLPPTSDAAVACPDPTCLQAPSAHAPARAGSWRLWRRHASRTRPRDSPRPSSTCCMPTRRPSRSGRSKRRYEQEARAWRQPRAPEQIRCRPAAWGVRRIRSPGRAARRTRTTARTSTSRLRGEEYAEERGWDEGRVWDLGNLSRAKGKQATRKPHGYTLWWVRASHQAIDTRFRCE